MKCALNIEKFFNLLISIKALCIYIQVISKSNYVLE